MFRQVPFSLENTPTTFQRLMEVVLSGMNRDGCQIHLDDVLVFTRALHEHSKNLQTVLDMVPVAGMKLKPRKCHFVQTALEYLGKVVSEKGVQTEPRNIPTVEKYPTPRDVKTLTSFLGLASCNRRLVPRFFKVNGPLDALTKDMDLS